MNTVVWRVNVDLWIEQAPGETSEKVESRVEEILTVDNALGDIFNAIDIREAEIADYPSCNDE